MFPLIYFLLNKWNCVPQANGKIVANGKKSHWNDGNDEPMSAGKKQHDKPKESFEPIPMLVACLTYVGFQFLMLLGFLSQLIFPPKVAIERNREVSHLNCPCPPSTSKCYLSKWHWYKRFITSPVGWRITFFFFYRSLYTFFLLLTSSIVYSWIYFLRERKIHSPAWHSRTVCACLFFLLLYMFNVHVILLFDILRHAFDVFHLIGLCSIVRQFWTILYAICLSTHSWLLQSAHL